MIKVRKKDILDNYNIVLKVLYCETEDLLRGEDCKFCTTGKDGWNADVYILDKDIVLVTGYRPFGTRNYDDILKKYNNIAKNINSKDYDWKEQKAQLELNLHRMIEEIKERGC